MISGLSSRRTRLVVTLGDPCGIGPELLLRSLGVLGGIAELLVVGSRSGLDLLESSRPPEQSPWTLQPADLPPAFQVSAQGAKVWHLERDGAAHLWLDPTPEILAGQLQLGRGSAASGRCALEAVRLGTDLVRAGLGQALVTLPLAKSAVHQSGRDIPGHTEYLQERCAAPQVRMAFLSPRLRVVLHTVHQSLRSVVAGLDAQAVAETLVFSAERISQLLGVSGLRVALCALNPHAGEEGAFGDEEQILNEAIEKARRADPNTVFSGPHPSDSLFLRAVRGEFDLVVALYHDQGLIPIKVLEPDRAVNVTLGLPFLRTSPDHGTAFDKAGRWIADPTNFQEAARLAAQWARRLPLTQTLPEAP